MCTMIATGACLLVIISSLENLANYTLGNDGIVDLVPVCDVIQHTFLFLDVHVHSIKPVENL